MIFSYRITKIEKLNNPTKMCQYNLIFYSAIMSNCWFLIVILGIPVYIIILIVIAFCCGYCFDSDSELKKSYNKLWKCSFFKCLWL